MTGPSRHAGWLATLALVLVGCGSLAGGAASRPAPVVHLVFIQLTDPGQVEALLADCDRLLPGIPGVVSYAAGRHIDIGRPNIDSDYDLALVVGFEDEAAYHLYVDHPAHVELVTTWKERFAALMVRDFGDSTP
jgi:hypothetical protein